MNNYLLRIIGLTAAYILLAWLGLSIAIIEGTVSPFWPASGLAIAALVLWGPRLWPAIAVGAFAAIYLIAGSPIAVAAGISAGNTLEALVGAWVLRRLNVRGEISCVRDAAALIAVELLASIPSVMAGAFSMYLGGIASWDSLSRVCAVWWLGNSLGTIIVLPLILAWAGQRVPGDYPKRPGELAGAIVLVVALAKFSYLYGQPLLSKLGVPIFPPAIFIFPPIIWALLRLRPRHAVLIMAIGSSLALEFVLAGVANGENLGPLLFLQLVLASVGGGWLILFGATAERQRGTANIRALHAKLEQDAALLERRVAERTAELDAARIRAEAADHVKSAFLATMSHELRTPLNSIIGFTGVLLQKLPGPLNAEQEKQLGIVRNASRHLLALINDVLDISKVEASELLLVREKFDLRLLLARLGGTFAPQAARRGLAFSMDIGDNEAGVTGDARRVEQVFNNLLSNALKFTPSGSITLTLAREGGAFIGTVTDTGVGIRREDMDKLFRPFSQIETGLPGLREGTGLGLAISAHLAQAMGGNIAVDSEWGKGSRFIFKLPAEAVHERAGDRGQRAKPLPGALPA